MAGPWLKAGREPEAGDRRGLRDDSLSLLPLLCQQPVHKVLLADLVHGDAVVTDEGPLGVPAASRCRASGLGVDSEGQGGGREKPGAMKGQGGGDPPSWHKWPSPAGGQRVKMKQPVPGARFCGDTLLARRWPLGLCFQLKGPLPAPFMWVALASG